MTRPAKKRQRTQRTLGAHDLHNVHALLESQFDKNLASTQKFLQLASISNEGTGMEEAAQYLCDRLIALGATAEICATGGYPVVYGELDAGQRRTLLVYGMYDVQPVKGEQWIVPPFAAETVDLEGLGPCLVCRGVFNSKGPLCGFLDVVEAYQQVRGLPVNLKFVIEGEEEMGSKHLPDFVRQQKSRLAADAVFFPFYSQNAQGVPILYLGCKGLIYLELYARGGETGGPVSRDVHSSFAAWVSSPTWRLVQALSTLVDRNETALISGFYDRVLPPNTEDEGLLAELESTFDEDVWLKEADAKRFKVNASGKELLREYLFSPTVTIDGLSAGYEGPGMKTVLPHMAKAKIDIRLVPGMDVADTLQKLRAHLDDRGFADLEFEVLGSYAPSKVSVKSSAVQALIETYQTHGYKPEVWPMIGGSAPFWLFTDELEMPIVVGGLGQGGRAHSPNEYATLEGMLLFEMSVATYLHRFGTGM